MFVEDGFRRCHEADQNQHYSCFHNERLPVTIRFADAVGEVILAAPQTGEPKLAVQILHLRRMRLLPHSATDNEITQMESVC